MPVLESESDQLVTPPARARRSGTFRLAPFPQADLPAISITGEYALEKRSLVLRYLLRGEIAAVSLPPISAAPRRLDGLWKSTCFEFFLAAKGRPAYREFNLSPAGDWNVYRMDAYRRRGFREETAITELPFVFRTEPGQFSLTLSVDLLPLWKSAQPLQMGIAAIIKDPHGRESYWALAHPGKQADFHRRESFILELEA